MKERRGRWLLGFLLLVLVAGWRWRVDLGWAQERVDEAIYLEAAEAVARGDSPYDVRRFLYPPAFAVVMSQGVEQLGPVRWLVFLRWLSLLAGAGILWASVARVGLRPVVRWSVCLLVLCFSPIIGSSVLYGNATFWIVGLALLGLALGPTGGLGRASSGSLALGLSVGLKPIAAAAVPMVFCSPRGKAPRGRWLAVGAGLVAVLVQGVGLEYVGDFLARAEGLSESSHNISLIRVLHCWGLDVPPVVVMAVVASAGCWWVWRRSPSPWELAALAGVFSVLSLPAVWLHTFVFTYPMQFLAVESWRRRRGRTGRWEWAWVGLGILAAHSGHGVGSLGHLPLPVQGALMALPVLAPLALAVYVFEWDRGSGSGTESPASHQLESVADGL